MLNEVMESAKTGHAVAAATAASGFSTWFDLIPDDIGKLATLLGIILSITLIIIHIRKAITDTRKHKVELEILLAQHKEMTK